MIRDDRSDPERKSKSQKKREMTALQELGEELVALSASALSKLDLPVDLRTAVEMARALPQRGAHKRQLQYIGRVMREVDAEPIRQALDALTGRQRLATVDFHKVERWRDRLLERETAAMSELAALYPRLDRQRLVRLIDAALGGTSGVGPPRATRELFHYLRELIQEEN